MRLECQCAAGLHSLGRHEGFCPIVTGRTWCDDCGQYRCVCPPIFTFLNSERTQHD